MSLINKMLQDLDARGSGGASAVQQDEVKAVPPRERDRRPLLLGGAAAGVLVVAAGGWYGWQYWQAHKAPPPPPVMKAIDTRVPDRPRFQEPPAAANMPQPPQAAGGKEVAAGTAQAAGDAQKAGSAAKPAPSARSAPMGDVEGAAAKPGRAKREVQVDAGDSAVAKPKRSARGEGAAADSAQPRKAARVAAASASEGMVVRELTPKQASENSYRRALAALQEGRVSAALADLDKAVEIDPRNDAARQTYVSLLLENHRTDDAIRQLRLALGIDPSQPGLAMVLARLQLEKGGPALDTLMNTLPYARDNADYHAFLAGVLQREQRHAEAADHYRQALQMSPQNAVWWMGLGISLQADQHLPEAREAYNRARSNPGLTPELRSFIERKLEQLSR